MLNDDFIKFKTHLRDFLISLKEFAGDNAELYAEEREQALQDAKAAERDRAMKVGGLLKPSEMEQEDELWSKVVFVEVFTDAFIYIFES